ncbi:hypothetical protein ACROYT_G002253 [Oculina patagonica]
MKLYLSLLVILMVTHACWSQCRNANWWGSFDRTGWSTCDSTTEYLTGFFRNDQWQNDPIYLLEEGTCCKAPAPIQDQASTCTNANWWGVLDSIHRWGVCPDGYFLQGLYRTAGEVATYCTASTSSDVANSSLVDVTSSDDRLTRFILGC